MTRYRIGIDLGGTKTEIAVLDADGSLMLRRRVPTPARYDAAIATIADLVRDAETEIGGQASVGVGIPGVISPATGVVKNANSNALNGHALDHDLMRLLGREVRVDNDANCFALSEAVDGTGAGHPVVFGVIIGTGCGAGVVIDGRVLRGRQRLTGEWGHNPLPWPRADELPGPLCWCGQHNCLESLVCGPAIARECDGDGARDASALPARAAAGDERARATLDRFADRLGRGLAQIVNFLDPDVIVLGGGLSNMDFLYERLPRLIGRHVFTDVFDTPVLRNRHGDSSGVRGAAWLWPAGG